MFRRKRDDATIGLIESQNDVVLNARSDMKLGNLLRVRGFDSLTQLLDAYHGRLSYSARRRRVFLSFHAEDLHQVAGFRLMLMNKNVELDLFDLSLKAQVNSINETYVRKVIREKINSCSVVICLIGNGTAWREWVDWELQIGLQQGKGLCGVKLKGSRGQIPPILEQVFAPIAQWDVNEIISTIECAAARRT